MTHVQISQSDAQGAALACRAYADILRNKARQRRVGGLNQIDTRASLRAQADHYERIAATMDSAAEYASWQL